MSRSTPGRPGHAVALAAALCLAGCAEPTAESTGERARPIPPSTIRFEPVAHVPGLDVVQLAGSPDVDHIIDSLGCGAAWLDYDRDGDADLYLAQGADATSPHRGPPDRLLRNEGDRDGDGMPEFADVTAEAGLGDRLWSFGVAVADYDNDGDPDLLVANWGPNRLYRNDGDGTFSEIAGPAGVADPRFSAAAVWGDVDRDGDLDLYVANYVAFDFDRYPARGERLAGGAPPCVWRGLEVFCGPRNLEAAPDAFYRNDGDPDGDGIPTFTEATAAAGLAVEPALFALAAEFFDADGDGDDDLYVANDSVQNSFFLNRGDGTFEELSVLAGLAYNEQGNEQAGMGIAVGDYDGDARLDLAVTNFSHEHDTLYRNEGGDLFLDVSYTAGIGSPSFLTLGWGILFLDADHDGWEELVVAHGHVYPQVDGKSLGTAFRQADGVFRNRGDGTFEDASASAGLGPPESSRALLPTDLDGDGDLDLLVTHLNAAPRLLRNTGATGSWLTVSLVGARSNRDGIGARIVLHSAGREQIREVRRSSSYAASKLPVAHFGLGAATEVDRLEVRWPSGEVSTREDLPARRHVVVRE